MVEAKKHTLNMLVATGAIFIMTVVTNWWYIGQMIGYCIVTVVQKVMVPTVTVQAFTSRQFLAS